MCVYYKLLCRESPKSIEVSVWQTSPYDFRRWPQSVALTRFQKWQHPGVISAWSAARHGSGCHSFDKACHPGYLRQLISCIVNSSKRLNVANN